VARRSTAEGPADTIVAANSSFVLAANRTYRKDPLNGFRKYPGGWNISEVHYWAVSAFENYCIFVVSYNCCLLNIILTALFFFQSVAYTAAPLFAVALLWFVLFFLVMLGICCHHCCCPHHSYKYSRTAYALSLTLLILFTCAAM
jgi:hypothetical protein